MQIFCINFMQFYLHYIWRNSSKMIIFEYDQNWSISPDVMQVFSENFLKFLHFFWCATSPMCFSAYFKCWFLGAWFLKICGTIQFGKWHFAIIAKEGRGFLKVWTNPKTPLLRHYEYKTQHSYDSTNKWAWIWRFTHRSKHGPTCISLPINCWKVHFLKIVLAYFSENHAPLYHYSGLST